jgi:hypothetical protein
MNGSLKKPLWAMKKLYVELRVLNNHQADAIEKGISFIQVFVISCNNIAFTYEEMGEIEKCKKMLKRVIYYFLFLSKGQADVSIIQNELKLALLAYKDFADKNALEPQDQQMVFDNIQEHVKSISTI